MWNEKNDKRNVLISILIYLFMFILGGSSIILLGLAFLYVIMNPDVSYLSIIMAVAGEITPSEMTSEVLAAYYTIANLTQFITYFVTTVAVVLFMVRFIIEDAKQIWKNLVKFIIVVPVSVIVFLVITLIVDNIIASLVGESVNQQSIVDMIANGGIIPMFFAVVVFAPLVEELIYRKAIFKLLENKPIILSYVVSTLIFAIPHMLSTQTDIWTWLLMCVPYLLSGGLLAGVYHVSGKNVFASWAVHVANNFLAYISIIFILLLQ